MDQETRWLKRYNEDEGPEKQTARGPGGQVPVSRNN